VNGPQQIGNIGYFVSGLNCMKFNVTSGHTELIKACHHDFLHKQSHTVCQLTV